MPRHAAAYYRVSPPNRQQQAVDAADMPPPLATKTLIAAASESVLYDIMNIIAHYHHAFSPTCARVSDKVLRHRASMSA